MKTRKTALALLSLALVAIAVLFLSRETKVEPLPGHIADNVQSDNEELPNEPMAQDSVETELVNNAPTIAPEDPSGPVSPEVVATRRMYAAHASLRSDTVDNPDSESNQRIKSQLIQKAFRNASAETE